MTNPNERWPRWIAEGQTVWFKADAEAAMESYGTARSRSAAVRLAGMLQEYSYRQHSLEAGADELIAKLAKAEAERDDYKGRNEAEYYRNEDLSQLLSETAKKLIAAEARLQVAVDGLKGLMAGIGMEGRLKADGAFDLYWDKDAAPALVAGWNAAIDAIAQLESSSR